MAKKQNPTLSLCMIVKNEEHFLPQCLDSVKDVVDEMVIVDTGSKDKTVEIAEKFGARVYHHPWEGDFSKARNTSLGYATGDWILVIDADEELERRDVVLLKNAIKSDAYDVIFCAVLSSSSHGISKNYSHRIFRRDKAHYEGIVHNQLVHNSAWLHTNIRIYHHGYNLSDEQMQAKFKRTQTLLEKQLEEEPQNAFAYQNYIRILRVQHQYREAAELGEKALKICNDSMNDLHFQMIAGDTSYCLISLGEYEKAQILVDKILHAHPRNMDVNFARALVLQGQKKYKDAIDAFLYFLKLNKEQKRNPQHTLVLIDSFDFEHRAWGNISDCYFYLQDFQNAKTALDKAISLKNDISVYYTAYARLLIELGTSEKARQMLKEYEIKGNTDPIFYEKWTGLAIQYPGFDDVTTILNRGVQKFPESTRLRNLLAFHLSNSESEKAKKEWETILQQHPGHIGAHIGLATLCASEGDKEKFKFHAKLILEKSTDMSVLKRIGGTAIRLEMYELAIDLLSKYLSLDTKNVDVLIDIATCYVKLHKYKAALTGYKEALRKSPGNPRVLQNLQALQHLLAYEKQLS